MLLLSSADFFQNLPSPKILSGTLSKCQTIWIQIRTDILSVLLWVQTVCKGYHQTTKVVASKERVDLLYPYWLSGISFIAVCFYHRGQFMKSWWLSHIWNSICRIKPNSANTISTFPPTGYQPAVIITGADNGSRVDTSGDNQSAMR